MVRKFKDPQLFRSTIRSGRIVGKGQSERERRFAYEAQVTERERTYNAVRKVSVITFPSRTQLAQEQRVYRILKCLGLPVPEFSRVRAEEISKGVDFPRLSIIAEDVRHKYGRIYDCHKSGNPKFLRKLRVGKDNKLIKQLAQDLALIYSNNIRSQFVDFWHFYKISRGRFKRPTWGRVYVDFNFFDIDRSRESQLHYLAKNRLDIKRNMRKAVWKLFDEEFRKHFDLEDNRPPKREHRVAGRL